MKIPYTFRDPSLLTLALTHASLSAESGGEHNQRLEFLGDSVVQLIVTEWLYAERGDWNEGELSRARAALVRTESFAGLADLWDLGARLRTGKKASVTVKVRADVFEAVVGAIYLDGGLEAARSAVLPLFGAAPQEPTAAQSPRSMLLEWAQAKKIATPVFTLEAESGLAHEKRFDVSVDVAGRRFGPVSGASKQAASVEAARLALAGLGVAPR